MVPGVLATDRKRIKNWFLIDFSNQCHAEFNNTYLSSQGNIDKIIKQLSYAKDAIVQCYNGNHQLCKKYSLVCSGRIKDNWIIKSGVLGAITNFKITPTPEDIDTLHNCWDYALSRKVSIKIAKNLNTQKTEAVNKAIGSNVPKNKTFTRNYSNRVHSTIQAVNRGTAAATLAQCSAVGCPITKGTRVAHQLLQQQKHQDNLKIKQTTLKYKKKRHYKMKHSFKLYMETEHDHQ